MPVSPDLAQNAARELLRIVSRAERQMLRTVARRVERGISEPGWAEAKLAELTSLRRDTRTMVARMQREADPAARAAILESWEKGLASARGDLKRADTVVRTAINRNALDALLRAAQDSLDASYLRVVRATPDIFRDVVVDTTTQLRTGTLTRREAAQRALDRFAARGITGFVDTAGRSWDLTSYTEMAVRSTSGQAAVQGHLNTLTASGHDLVIVSDAPEECPLCRPWEGKVLSIAGTSVGQEAGGFVVEGSIADARSAGLFHPGCRHATGMFTPGLTRPLRNTADPVGNAERQQQRYLERQVRYWKRRGSLSITDGAHALAGRKTREWQGSLKQFVDANDRKRLRYRESLGAR